MLRVSFNGERISLGQTGQIVASDKMDFNRVLSSFPNYEDTNKELERLEQRIMVLSEELLDQGCLTLEALRDLLSSSKDKQHHEVMMSELFDLEKEDMDKKLKADKVKPTTYNRHLCARRNFEDFLSFKYKKKDIKAIEVNRSMISEYEDYLGTYVGYDRNTVVKYLFLLGKPIKYAYRNELIDRNPFDGLKFPQKKTDRGYLTDEEVSKIWNAELTLERLALVRDAFVFSCLTGLSYIDVRNLTEDDISVVNGAKYIIIQRQKTATRCEIPLMKIAESIIDKYKDKVSKGGRLMPIFTNQVTNRYLKEIGEISGVKKNLTFHLARHTFATTALTKGLTLETLSRVLGHTRIQTTQIYARITTNKITEEMQRLEQRLIKENYLHE